MSVDVGIVGAGLAGLACARQLRELGLSCALFEASDRVGGRVVTDRVDGYLLDRGFQVLLDSYPQARRVLDLAELNTRPFAPGALVWKDGKFFRISDPWRAPLRGLSTLRAPFVTMKDAARMSSLRKRALEHAEQRTDQTATELLAECGFSEGLRESFFRPFFGGITLDADLTVPASYFLALFGWFAKGSAVLPAGGMQAIAEQLAGALPVESIHLNSQVATVTPNSIRLESGDELACGAVVLATDGSTTAKLTDSRDTTEWLGTTTIYYSASESPVGEAILAINGEGPSDGPVNHLCVLSDAQPTYAPAGSALLSVSLLGVTATPDAEVDLRVRKQLASWYGAAEVASWKLLRVDRIEQALPRLRARKADPQRADGLFVCGDHVATPSIQGALESGWTIAQRLGARVAGVKG